MSAPVDLTNLRSMTDGDTEMEKELFSQFNDAFDIGIASLQENMADASAEIWRTTAHSLKGIAINLGANNLGNLCKYAQEQHTSNAESKSAILHNLRSEYACVKHFLLSL